MSARDVFDEPDCALDRGRRVVLEAEREREVEQHLGVGLALDRRVERRVDGENEVPFDRGELVDVSVVHEQPMVVAKGMAVGLLDGAADRRADVREEQRGADVPREIAQVAVVPGRFDAVKHARSWLFSVPAEAEPVPVGRLRAEPRMQALVD